jgi:hypothetical protein
MKTIILAAALWNALVTYNSGKVITHEGMKTERMCLEVLCSIQFDATCEEHDKRLAEAKRLNDAAALAYHLSVAKYRIKHPCATDKKKMTCEDPDGSSRVFEKRKDGKWDWTMDISPFQSSQSLGTIGPGESRTVTIGVPTQSNPTAHAVCYQDKP